MIGQNSLQQESKTRDCKKYENMNTQGDLWVMHCGEIREGIGPNIAATETWFKDK
jgi:hypothetical protein